MEPWIWKFIGVALYLSVLLGIGVVASRRVADMRDYFAAGKDLGFWSVAFSSRATGESAWLLLGLTGMGATVGVQGFWVVLGEVIGVAGAWLFMARRFNQLTRKYDSLTVPDYLTSRFRDDTGLIRGVAALTLVIFVVIYVSAQIDATGAAFESFLGVNYHVGSIVGFGVVMAYSTTGGFTAVVWSDIFQGLLMFAGLVALPLTALFALGGFGPAVTQLTAIDPTLLSLSGPTGWDVSVVMKTLGLAMIGLGFLGSPQVFTRFLALRDPDEVNKGMWVALIWTLMADSGAVLTGLFGRALLESPGVTMVGEGGLLGNGGQDVLPLLVETVMPAAIVGLYIAIVLSAIMSTVDSLLVLASSAAVRDLYQKTWNPGMSDEGLVRMSQVGTLALGGAALAISLTIAAVVPGRTVFWFVIFGWSGIAATFCPTMILSLYWSRMTRNGAVAAMLTGFLGVPLFKFVLVTPLEELPPAFLLSFIVGISVSLMGTAPAIGDELAEAAR